MSGVTVFPLLSSFVESLRLMSGVTVLPLLSSFVESLRLMSGVTVLPLPSSFVDSLRLMSGVTVFPLLSRFVESLRMVSDIIVLSLQRMADKWSSPANDSSCSYFFKKKTKLRPKLAGNGSWLSWNPGTKMVIHTETLIYKTVIWSDWAHLLITWSSVRLQLCCDNFVSDNRPLSND